MTELVLPVIDISQTPQEIEGDRLQYHPEVAKLAEACKEWGFFRVVNHGIPADLLQKVLTASRDLLSLPVEVKDRVTTSNPLRSYFRLPCLPPQHELFCFENMPNPHSIQEISRKIWSESGNSDFCETFEKFGVLVSDLAAKITKLVIASLGLDAKTFYQSDFEKCIANLLLNGYSSHGKCVGDVATESHTDLCSLSILYNDEMEGLEIRSKGGEWFNVKPQSDSFVVNLGDCFKAWSNDRYRSANHRVIYRGWEKRISLPFFTVFPDDAQIWGPEQLVDADHPRRYKPFLNCELMKESTRNIDAGGKYGVALERLAGI